MSKATLLEIAGANPLRAAHPLTFRQLKDLRGGTKFPAPPPPKGTTRSSIKVGMFDGGVDASLPHLHGHVEQDDGLSIKTKVDSLGVAHGTAVAGALLYGPLNDKDPIRPLATPLVSVVSVRCLPTSDPKDVDLYECIDVVEEAVPVTGPAFLSQVES